MENVIHIIAKELVREIVDYFHNALPEDAKIIAKAHPSRGDLDETLKMVIAIRIKPMSKTHHTFTMQTGVTFDSRNPPWLKPAVETSGIIRHKTRGARWYKKQKAFDLGVPDSVDDVKWWIIKTVNATVTQSGRVQR